jgi:hypothetical protein
MLRDLEGSLLLPAQSQGEAHEDARILIRSVQEKFIAAQAAEIVDKSRQCHHCPILKKWGAQSGNPAATATNLPYRITHPHFQLLSYA